MPSKEFADRLPATPSLAGLLDALKYDADGLLTVVVQDAATREAMIRRFYGHDYVKPIKEIKLLRVGNAIVSRVLQ